MPFYFLAIRSPKPGQFSTAMIYHVIWENTYFSKQYIFELGLIIRYIWKRSVVSLKGNSYSTDERDFTGMSLFKQNQVRVYFLEKYLQAKHPMVLKKKFRL